MRLILSLGHGDSGLPNGEIQALSPAMAPLLYTPQSLGLLTLPGAVTPVYLADGTLRQVGSRQCLADVQILQTGRSYRVVFYDADRLIPGHDGQTVISTNGLAPFVTWTVENPDANASNRVQIIETRGSLRITNLYAWSESLQQWEFFAGNNTRKELLSNAWDESHTVRTETRQTSDPATGALLAQTVKRYGILAWGEALLEEINGANGLTETNSYSYFDAADGAALEGKLESVDQGPRGTRSFNYDGNGRLDTTTVPYALVSEETAFDFAARTEYGDDTSLWPLRPRSVTRKVSAGTVGVSKFAASGDTTIQAEFDGTRDLCTTNHYYPAGHDSAFRLRRVDHPNGTIALYTYGTNAAARTNIVLQGEPNPARDALVRGTRTLTVLGGVGELLRRETYDIAPEHPDGVLTSREVYTYTDSLKQSHTVTHLDGTSNSAVYACCGLESTTDRDGLVTLYFYDGLKRLIATKLNSFNLTTSNVLDAAGRDLATIRFGGSSPLTLSQRSYDILGRLLAETNGLQGVTRYNYSAVEPAGLLTEVTYADGGTRYETNAPDGKLLALGGTAVHPLTRVFTYWGGGALSTEGKLDDNGNSVEEHSSYQDLLGRTVEEGTAGGAYRFSVFNSLGQLASRSDSDNVTNLFGYNSLGELEYSAVDMDHDGQIGLLGPDRITRTVTSTGPGTAAPAVNVHRTQTFVWTNASSSTPLFASTREVSVDGLRSWVITPAGTNESWTYYAANGYRYVTNTAPDRSSTISQYRYGRLLEVTQKDAAGSQLGKTTRAYDAHGRLASTTDARNGTTTFTYHSSADLVASVTTPAPGAGAPPQTTWTYYNQMLQATNVVQPDGGSSITEFYPSGKVKKISGSRTYPVGYTYDFAGRVKRMSTWADGPGDQGEAITQWDYNAAGQLAAKLYADPATGQPRDVGVSYGYTTGGRLYQRAWERGLSTFYSYNRAGDLESISSSDQATAVVTNVYDRRGRVEAVLQGDAVTTHSFNEAGQLLAEAYSGGSPLAGLTVTNGFDHLLRRTNLRLLLGSTLLAGTEYNWDQASRLSSVAQPSTTSSQPVSATYSYLANSPLVSQIAFASNGVTRMTTTKTFDLANRLTAISSVPASGSPVSFDYTYNSANQRTLRREADGGYWRYEYDSLAQVISGKKYWSDGTPVAGQQFEYAFDDIGNRTSSKAGGDESGANLREAAYYPNLLNQYWSNTVPGAVDVMGIALATNSVTVNGQAPYRKGEYFRQELTVDNTAAPVWESVTVTAPNESSVTRTEAVPQTPQAFTHDADGNLTQDGLWQYIWDSENRLVAMESLYGVPDERKQRLEFGYDHQGRRIQRITSTWDGQLYSPQTTNRFVYDGWNLIAVLDHTNGLTRSFGWGTDLSGTLQGAGGVGGLLWVHDTSTINNQPSTHFVCFDANGNVAALIDASSSTLSAQFEYGPFGEVLRATGPMAIANPFRFSTKYQDDETDLLYYGFRYYNASTGRWLSRDPIGERDSHNLYCFVSNIPETAVDRDGRITVQPGIGAKGTCGSYAVGWVFSLDRPAPCDGYIVQKVTKRDSYGKCGKPGKRNDSTFWEAWSVSEGTTLPPSVSSPSGTPATDLDLHITPGGGGHWGYHFVLGEVKFFCGATTGDLAESGFEKGRAPESGSLPSALNEPSWWNRPSDNGEASASRLVTANWSCCCGRKYDYNIINWRP